MKMTAMSPPCGVWLATFFTAACLQGASAASLRATPVPKSAAKNEATASKSKETAAVKTEAIEAATKLAEALAKKSETKEAAPKPAVQQRQKLDVGFADFEKNLTEGVTTQLLHTTNSTTWTNDMRNKLTQNVSAGLRDSLKVTLQGVKQSIGKTWMALPQDAQKNEYVAALKSAFLPVFSRSMETVNSHLELTLKRLDTYSHDKKLSAKDLLEKSEFSVGDSLLTEHCYEVGNKKNLNKMQKPANKTEVLADKKKFCIQSVVGALAKRLNDTQGLISMSMRFEAGAMSLAQQQKKKKKPAY